MLSARDNRDRLTDVLSGMQARLQHRGPDDAGQFIDVQGRVGFVHTRLSILDLSPAGHQPMMVEGGRYTIVFNGEVYNFQKLRDELIAHGISFQSHSDTEVILRLFQREGPNCVRRFEGMFAFALWDNVEQSCFLARDPLGIKPLYVWDHDGSLAFGSELRAVLEADLAPRRLNPDALRGYLLFGSVQEPLTLVDGIETLPAGYWMTWKNGKTHREKYWSVEFPVPAKSRPTSEESSEKAAVATARQALLESVRKHHVSDVPVCLFLSGGIDSTALLGLSKSCGFDNLRTFSISFGDAAFNEGDLAAKTAAHFGTNHHDWRMEDSDGLSLITEFLKAMDQPSTDGFNTYCVSKFAHDQGAKVVLSGLGGDELFGGYPSFSKVPKLRQFHRYASLAGRLPRRLAGGLIKRSTSVRNRRLGAFLMSRGNMDAAYWTMRGSFLPDECALLVQHFTAGDTRPETVDFEADMTLEALDPADAVCVLETTRYMRNQLLRDSDVMSMAWSLELRVPFVDQRLLDSISSIPSRIRLARGKQLLLDSVPEIPEWIRAQRKRGFRFPFERWFSDSWKDMFQQLDATVPVSLDTWYRRWSLFTLQHFLTVNRIQTSSSGLARPVLV